MDILPKTKKIGREYIIRGVLLDDKNPQGDISSVLNFIAMDLENGKEMSGNLSITEFKLAD